MATRSSARLRKTFHFPADDDSDSQPEALDEQEQSELIEALAIQNKHQNAFYKQAFTLFPLALVLPNLLSVFTGASALLAILSVSSLLCTAWAMQYVPEGMTGLFPLDNLLKQQKQKGKADTDARRRLDLSPPTMLSPIEKYLPVMNVVLVVVILVAGILKNMRESRDLGESWESILCVSPALALVVVVGVKIVLGSVDVRELEELRYGLKGA